ncbi:hypothetical protein A2U01_0086596, partial [Trifolium medium]|nr:hypothetical protein [Trifolium medium]
MMQKSMTGFNNMSVLPLGRAIYLG